MEHILIQFASAGVAEKQDLFGSLGINWQLLILQTIAFLILLAILKKFVYPPLSSMLDKREDAIRASADAAMEAERHAAEAEARAAELIEEAKKEAAEIVATARDEAAETSDATVKKAENKAEALVNSAREEMAKELAGAKAALKSETIELVALATGKILDEKVDARKDSALIEKALKGTK